MAEICHLWSWRQNVKKRFSQKTKQFKAMDFIIGSLHGLFKEPIIESLKSKMTEIRLLENRNNIIFFCRGWSDLDKICETGAEWHVDCGYVVEIETRCRIPIWRTFGRIQWHVIPEPRIILHGAATWWIHCHDSSATCHSAVTWRDQCHDRATLQGVRIPFAILQIVFCHILFFVFNAV